MSELLVRARDVGMTYHPTSWWLRLFVKSSLTESVTALRDIHLDLRRGEILGVVGPNGAGKSTLFRAIVGQLIPTTGTIEILGVDPVRAGQELRRQIGFMPADDRTLFLRQSCLDNLRFRGRLLGLRGQSLETKVADVLDVVGIGYAADRAAVALSSGMRYRLMLARALLGDPQILILDEPTGPLDPMVAHDFIRTLRELATSRDIGVIVSSHRMDDVEAMPQRVLLLHEGSIRYDGPVEELRRRNMQPLIDIRMTTGLGASQAAESLQAAGFDAIANADVVTVSGALTAGPVLEAIGETAGIVQIAPRARSLREVITLAIRSEDT